MCALVVLALDFSLFWNQFYCAAWCEKTVVVLFVWWVQCSSFQPYSQLLWGSTACNSCFNRIIFVIELLFFFHTATVITHYPELLVFSGSVVAFVGKCNYNFCTYVSDRSEGNLPTLLLQWSILYSSSLLESRDLYVVSGSSTSLQWTWRNIFLWVHLYVTKTIMGNCLSNWYKEGIETDPPPCLNSKTFYCICRWDL